MPSYHLKDVKYPDNYEYSSDGELIPIQFYLDVLPKCSEIYLKLGYFSSAAIRVLAFSFAQFIYNGGTIRFITNHFLYNNDLELLDNAKGLKLQHDKKLYLDLSWLSESLQGPERHFIECLKYLVREHRLEIVPVQLKPSRMLHYKQGIFIDECGDSVYMEGSCNFTASGLVENAESVSVYRSWGSDFEKKKISGKRQEFETILDRKNPDYLYLDSNSIKDAVSALGEDKSISELLRDELELFKASSAITKVRHAIERSKVELQELIEAFENSPRFPFNAKPRDYQKEAYENWTGANRKGIFAMATGTGKTITALNCLLGEFQTDNHYQALIVVPTKVLLKQWYSEVLSFNFLNVILVSSDYKDWKDSLRELSASLLYNNKKNFVVLVTYASISSERFLKEMLKLPPTTVFIADEAHNIGQKKVKAILPDLAFTRRIALSATPKRAWDPEGNDLIENFFESKEPYTYTFTMEKAIRDGHLCEYDYYPHIVSLNADEMDEYIAISNELRAYFDFEKRQLRQIKAVEILLQERKRIIHKAEGKVAAFRGIILEHMRTKGNLKYSFVYAPEGVDKGGGESSSQVHGGSRGVPPVC